MLKQTLKKGKTKMRNKTKQIHNYLTKFKAYNEACILFMAGLRTAKIAVPATVGAYLIYKYDDKLIIAIGVAGIVYSTGVALFTSYLVEKKK